MFISVENNTTERVNKAEFPEFIVTEVPCDGNCLFHSLNHQLDLPVNKQTAASMRAELCTYLTEQYSDKWETLAHPAVGEGLAAYVERMSRNGEFGDGIMLEMFGHKYKRAICIRYSNSEDTICLRPDCDNSTPVYLGYTYRGFGTDQSERNHYVSLTPTPASTAAVTKL